MTRLDGFTHQRWRYGQADAGLTDVVRWIGQELGTARVDLLPACPRTDCDAIATCLTNRFDHKLLKMVQGVLEGFRLAADVGFDIREDRILAEVVADGSGHVGVNRFVVGYSSANCVRQRNFARSVRLHQPWDTDHAVRPEYLRVEEIIVDAVVDHLHPHKTGDRPHIDLLVLNYEVRAHDEWHTHLTGKEDVFEECGVVRTG